MGTEKSIETKNNIIGEWLYNARINKGYTQTKLSELSGIHKENISLIENGNSYPKLSTLARLAPALDIENDYIGVTHLGERLKNTRINRGWSLRTLGDKVYLRAQSIYKYEQGCNLPRIEYLIPISQALDVSLQWLIFGRE